VASVIIAERQVISRENALLEEEREKERERMDRASATISRRRESVTLATNAGFSMMGSQTRADPRVERRGRERESLMMGPASATITGTRESADSATNVAFSMTVRRTLGEGQAAAARGMGGKAAREGMVTMDRASATITRTRESADLVMSAAFCTMGSATKILEKVVGKLEEYAMTSVIAENVASVMIAGLPIEIT